MKRATTHLECSCGLRPTQAQLDVLDDPDTCICGQPFVQVHDDAPDPLTFPELTASLEATARVMTERAAVEMTG